MRTRYFVGVLFVFVCLFVLFYASGFLFVRNVADYSMFGVSRGGHDREFEWLLDARVKNPDVYAWVRVEGTKVSYPVVQHRVDDDFYLGHDVDGARSIYGAIFTQRYNSRSFNDPFVVVYGHGMRDGSMFGSLRLFKDRSFFDKHRFVVVWGENGVRYRYEIVSAYVLDNEHLFSKYDFASGSKRRDYLDGLERRAKDSAGFYRKVDVKGEARVIALSTCNSAGDDNRFVVQAVLMEEVKIDVK